jgi:hypothetical protein
VAAVPIASQSRIKKKKNEIQDNIKTERQNSFEKKEQSDSLNVIENFNFIIMCWGFNLTNCAFRVLEYLFPHDGCVKLVAIKGETVIT